MRGLFHVAWPLLFAVAILAALIIAQAPARRACHKSGGVFLSRDWVCVAGPPPVRQ